MANRFKLYWLCKSDVWYLLPVLKISVEQIGSRIVLGLEVVFLKRWIALEFDLKKVTYEPIVFPSNNEVKFIESKFGEPTLPELISYIKAKRLELLEWLPLMKLQDWDTELICDEAEKEVVQLQAIEEYLIANRNGLRAVKIIRPDIFPLSPCAK